MVAFLDCLKQLMDYACAQDGRVEFPQVYVAATEEFASRANVAQPE